MKGLTGWQADIRRGLRRVVRFPQFSSWVVLLIGIGVGGTTAVFAIVHSLLVRPLPYADSERLVLLGESFPRRGSVGRAVFPSNFEQIQERNRAFEEVAAFVPDVQFDLVGGGDPEEVHGAVAAGNFFPLLGATAFLGRTLLPQDDVSRDDVVVLANHLWRQRFGADRNVLGSQVLLNGISYTVIGVMSPGFDFPTGTQLWISRPWEAHRATNAGFMIFSYFRVLAKVKPGFSSKQLQGDLEALARWLREANPQKNEGLLLIAVPLREKLYGELRPALSMLMGAVCLVLVLACANICALLLARGYARRKEIATCLALGATRFQVVRQLLAEGIVLALAGGAVGLVLSTWIQEAVLSVGPFEVLPASRVERGVAVWGFAFGATLVSSLLFSLVPAILVTKGNLSEALKDAQTLSAPRGSRRFLRNLTVLEATLTLVLVAVSGGLLKHFVNLLRTPLGFVPEQVLALQLSLRADKYPESTQRNRFLDAVLERIRSIKGVRDAAVVDWLPLSGGRFQILVTYESSLGIKSTDTPDLNLTTVSASYFSTMGIAVRTGRSFREHDLDRTSPVAIVDEVAARKLWGDEVPVGKRISVQGVWCQVVGLVGPVRQDGYGHPSQGQIYVPHQQSSFPWPSMYIVVRAEREVSQLAKSIQQQVWAVDPNQPIAAAQTLESMASRTVGRQRFAAVMLGPFAVFSLLLAGFGSFALTSFAVSERTREMMIRIALGATLRNVQWTIFREALGATGLGLSLGLLVLLVLGRFLPASYLEDTDADAVVLLSSGLMLAIVSFVAAYYASHKALSFNPNAVLREP